MPSITIESMTSQHWPWLWLAKLPFIHWGDSTGTQSTWSIEAFNRSLSAVMSFSNHSNWTTLKVEVKPSKTLSNIKFVIQVIQAPNLPSPMAWPQILHLNILQQSFQPMPSATADQRCQLEYLKLLSNENANVLACMLQRRVPNTICCTSSEISMFYMRV